MRGSRRLAPRPPRARSRERSAGASATRSLAAPGPAPARVRVQPAGLCDSTVITRVSIRGLATLAEVHPGVIPARGPLSPYSRLPSVASTVIFSSPRRSTIVTLSPGLCSRSA